MKGDNLYTEMEIDKKEREAQTYKRTEREKEGI